MPTFEITVGDCRWLDVLGRCWSCQVEGLMALVDCLSYFVVGSSPGLADDPKIWSPLLLSLSSLPFLLMLRLLKARERGISSLVGKMIGL